MPLPKIEVPNHKINIFSTTENITYRPFLVKEEKILLTALAGENNEEIIQAIRQIVQNCIIKPEINVEILPMFDLEYLFVNLRSKSVGSISEIGLECNNCGEENRFEINLEEIELKRDPSHTQEIELVESSVGVIMKYPTIELINNASEEGGVEELYSLISNCIDIVYTPDEEHNMNDYTEEERTSFFESLTQEHFLKLQNFFNTIPYTHYNLDYNCQHCEHQEDMELRGINNFFT